MIYLQWAQSARELRQWPMIAGVKVLELCMNIYHMNSLKFFELLLLRRNTLLEVLPDGAVGHVNQGLRNVKCCAKCNCHKVQSKG